MHTEAMGATGVDKKALVKESLFNFITSHVPNADLSAIDEIILSYVYSAMDIAPSDFFAHVTDFMDIVSAYVTDFSKIDQQSVYTWMKSMVSCLDESKEPALNGIFGEPIIKMEEDKENVISFQSLNNAVVEREMLKQSRSNSSSEDNEEGAASNVMIVDAEDMSEQIEVLQEMFPNTAPIEIKHCVSIASGVIDGAIATLLHRRDQGQALVPATLHPANNRIVTDDTVVRACIIDRYSYVDREAEKNKEHKPVPLPDEPRKLVRYRDNKIVSLKGERFTEPESSGQLQVWENPKIGGKKPKWTNSRVKLDMTKQYMKIKITKHKNLDNGKHFRKMKIDLDKDGVVLITTNIVNGISNTKSTRISFRHKIVNIFWTEYQQTLMIKIIKLMPKKRMKITTVEITRKSYKINTKTLEVDKEGTEKEELMKKTTNSNEENIKAKKSDKTKSKDKNKPKKVLSVKISNEINPTDKIVTKTIESAKDSMKTKPLNEYSNKTQLIFDDLSAKLKKSTKHIATDTTADKIRTNLSNLKIKTVTQETQNKHSNGDTIKICPKSLERDKTYHKTGNTESKRVSIQIEKEVPDLESQSKDRSEFKQYLKPIIKTLRNKKQKHLKSDNQFSKIESLNIKQESPEPQISERSNIKFEKNNKEMHIISEIKELRLEALKNRREIKLKTKSDKSNIESPKIKQEMTKRLKLESLKNRKEMQIKSETNHSKIDPLTIKKEMQIKSEVKHSKTEPPMNKKQMQLKLVKHSKIEPLEIKEKKIESLDEVTQIVPQNLRKKESPKKSSQKNLALTKIFGKPKKKTDTNLLRDISNLNFVCGISFSLNIKFNIHGRALDERRNISIDSCNVYALLKVMFPLFSSTDYVLTQFNFKDCLRQLIYSIISDTSDSEVCSIRWRLTCKGQGERIERVVISENIFSKPVIYFNVIPNYNLNRSVIAMPFMVPLTNIILQLFLLNNDDVLRLGFDLDIDL